MGNINNKEISYDRFFELINESHIEAVCNTPEECQKIYQNRILEGLNLLVLLFDDSKEGLDNLQIYIDDNNLSIDVKNRQHTIESLVAEAIANILLQNNIKAQDWSVDNFEQAKNVFLQYLEEALKVEPEPEPELEPEPEFTPTPENEI